MGNSASLGSLIAEVSKGANQTQLVAGTCIYDTGAWRVYRGGIEVPNAVWLESASPRTGPCLLAVAGSATGQATTYVLGSSFADPYRDQDIGTAASNGTGGFSIIALRDGTEVSCRYFSHYVPTVSDVVMVIWRGGEGYIIGKFPLGHRTEPITPLPPGMPVLPPRVAPFGESTFPAYGYRTWDATLDSWTTQKTRSVRLTSTMQGVFAYQNATKSLTDKNQIDRVTITFGTRLVTSAEPGNITLNLYRSDAENVSNVARPTNIDGPWEVVVPATYNGGELSLPVELGEALKMGGSITVTTSSPISFADSPASGYLKIEWNNRSA